MLRAKDLGNYSVRIWDGDWDRDKSLWLLSEDSLLKLRPGDEEIKFGLEQKAGESYQWSRLEITEDLAFVTGRRTRDGHVVETTVVFSLSDGERLKDLEGLASG